MSFLKCLFLICCSFSISSSVESNCTDIFQFDDEVFGCKNCPGCMKGYGLDLTENIPRTERGMKICYSCKPCPLGTYQNESVVIEICKQCDRCENKKIQKNCSAEEDAICKDSLEGYHEVINNESSIICEKVKCAETTNYYQEMKIYQGLFIFTFIVLILVLFYLIKKKELRNVLTIFPCCNKDKQGKTNGANTTPDVSTPMHTGDTETDKDQPLPICSRCRSTLEDEDEQGNPNV